MPLIEQAWSGYGDARFAAASAAARRLHKHRRRRVALAALTRDRHETAALVRILLALPVLRVRTSNAPAGRSIRAMLNERRLGLRLNRIAQSVLVLPSTLDEYLRGHSRQALRTNLGHAERDGVTCVPLHGDATRRTMLCDWFAGSAEADPGHLEDELQRIPSGSEWWIARTDTDPTPIAFAIVTIDREWALLHALRSRSHPARWALHTRCVQSAINAGARFLWVHERSPLILPESLQYFQRRLGYDIFHLRFHRTDWRPRRSSTP